MQLGSRIRTNREKFIHSTVPLTPHDFQTLYRSVSLLVPKLAKRGRRFLLKSSTLHMRNTLALAHSHRRRAAAWTPVVADTTLQIARRPIAKPGKDGREGAGSRMRFQSNLCQRCIDQRYAVTQQREGREPAKSPHRPIPCLHWTLPLLLPTQTHKSKHHDTHLNISTRARTMHAHAVYKCTSTVLQGLQVPSRLPPVPLAASSFSTAGQWARGLTSLTQGMWVDLLRGLTKREF